MFNCLPAQMRATIEDKFHTRVKMAAATAFLWEHDSQASRKRRTQKLPSCKRPFKLSVILIIHIYKTFPWTWVSIIVTSFKEGVRWLWNPYMVQTGYMTWKGKLITIAFHKHSVDQHGMNSQTQLPFGAVTCIKVTENHKGSIICISQFIKRWRRVQKM